MKFLKIFLFALVATSMTACFKVKSYDSASKPINHALFDSLLKNNVNKDGFVNYEGFIRDSVAFNKYLDLLSKNHPNESQHWCSRLRLIARLGQRGEVVGGMIEIGQRLQVGVDDP